MVRLSPRRISTLYNCVDGESAADLPAANATGASNKPIQTKAERRILFSMRRANRRLATIWIYACATCTSISYAMGICAASAKDSFNARSSPLEQIKSGLAVACHLLLKAGTLDMHQIFSRVLSACLGRFQMAKPRLLISSYRS